MTGKSFLGLILRCSTADLMGPVAESDLVIP